MLEFTGNILSLSGLTLAILWHSGKTVPAVVIYGAVQVLYSSPEGLLNMRQLMPGPGQYIPSFNSRRKVGHARWQAVSLKLPFP